MEILHVCCAGLDVHKRTVVACVLKSNPAAARKVDQEIKSFGTTAPDLLELSDWLREHGVTHVAMESTGSFWLPVYNILEGNFELVVANAAHIKNVPGRKTDVADSQWIAQLLRHGLLRASFIPERPQRQLRELTRHRTNLVAKKAQAVNELQRTLESNLKLQSVVTDITGVSATEMLSELLAGNSDAKALAQLAKKRLRHKIPELEKALEGKLEGHHQLILKQLLADIALFESQVAELDQEIARRVEKDHDDMDRLDKIPGINQRVAEVIVAEAGTDMSRFPTAGHFASWIGLCPGQNESAGKRKSGRTRKGNKALRAALVEAAQGAQRTKGSYYGALYRRLAARRGKKKALIAVAHSMAIAAYHMLKSKKPYQELGASYHDQLNALRVINRLTKRIENLGFLVHISPMANAA